MDGSRSGVWGRGVRGALAGGLVALVAGTLSACVSSGGAGGLAHRLFESQPAADAEPIDPNYFIAVSQCPDVDIRSGTESVTVYDRRGETDPANVRYLGSITNTARECRDVGGQLTLKVGVEGRVIGGPKVRPGQVTVPVRIAVVRNGDNVLFSQLYNVPVTLAAPDFSTPFAYVEETIAVPIPGAGDRLRIYVGFDDKAPQGRRSRG